MARNPRSVPVRSASVAAASDIIALPDGGRVYAVVIGVEEYRSASTPAIPRVDYARNDATAFAAVLADIFPEDRLDVRILLDNEVTVSTIHYELKGAIDILEEDDLLIFYYAGHGFHGAGGNRITGWDTHPHHIDTTTVLLRSALFDPFEAGRGKRLLAFIDACARRFAPTVPGRDVVAELNEEELRRALAVERYSGVFLSCEPGQASFPADAHGHGAWTYFLLQALSGTAEQALDRERYLTDRSLKDYLTAQVPRFLREQTTIRGQQRPRAIIDASRTFAIYRIPDRAALAGGSEDFSDIRVAPDREYFEHVETGRISSLPGFSKKSGHFIPERVSDAASGFVAQRMAETITEEMQSFYDEVKAVFKLRRKEISLEDDLGQARLDTDFFRFSIEAKQDAADPSGYVVLRRLELREGAESRLDDIDSVFGGVFSRIVVQQRGGPPDFDELVEQLEDVVEARGGTVRDEPARGRVTYTGEDGTVLVFDTEQNCIRLEGGGKQDCAGLLERARQYRFGLTARSTLLAGSRTQPDLPASGAQTRALPAPRAKRGGKPPANRR